MPTRNVVLTEHQTRFVDELVASGRYQNASEILREGLRLVERHESEHAARLMMLREAARQGMADIESGAFGSFESTTALNQFLTALATEKIDPR